MCRFPEAKLKLITQDISQIVLEVHFGMVSWGLGVDLYADQTGKSKDS